MRQTPVCSVWATLTTSVTVPRQFYLSAFLMRTSMSVLKDIRWNINPHPGCQVCKRKHLGGLLGPLHLSGWFSAQSSLIVENELTIRQAHLWIYDNQNQQIHNHHQNQQRQYPAASKPSSHLQRRALLDPWLSGKLLGCIWTNNSLSIWFWWWWKLKTNNPLTALSKKTFILLVYQLEYHHARVPLSTDLLHIFSLEHLNLAMQPKVFIFTKNNDKTYCYITTRGDL